MFNSSWLANSKRYSQFLPYIPSNTTSRSPVGSGDAFVALKSKFIILGLGGIGHVSLMLAKSPSANACQENSISISKGYTGQGLKSSSSGVYWFTPALTLIPTYSPLFRSRHGDQVKQGGNY
jgi:hypothetical protein